MDIFLVAARIFIAAFLGALIGTEREKKNKAAGFRTHIIVSVGACLIMLIAIDGASELSDAGIWEPARFVGQVVSGIGFLGAGTILQKKNEVSGLTTAATLWLSAGIGLAVGIGYYKGAVLATITCLITLISLKEVSDLINNKMTKSYIIVFDTPNFEKEDFLQITLEEGIEIRELDILDEEVEGTSMIESTLSFHKNYNIGNFFKKLKVDYHLTSVKLSSQENKIKDK